MIGYKKLRMKKLNFEKLNNYINSLKSLSLTPKDAKIASSIAFSDAELAIGYMLEKIPWHLKPSNVNIHGLKEI